MFHLKKSCWIKHCLCFIVFVIRKGGCLTRQLVDPGLATSPIYLIIACVQLNYQ